MSSPRGPKRSIARKPACAFKGHALGSSKWNFATIHKSFIFK